MWRLWKDKGKSDVYISARTLAGVVKVSLHESGDWRFAFHEPFWKARVAPRAEDRRIERWARPPPINGITPAFMIVVPFAEIGLPRRPLPDKAKKYAKDAIWVTPAPEGFATYFNVMYTNPGGPEPSEHDRFIGRFGLPNGQTVSVLIQEHAIAEGQQRQLEAARRAISAQISEGQSIDRADLEAALEPRGYLYGYNEYGTRFFIDISGSFLFE